MSDQLPDTENVNVTAYAIAWEIVRLTGVRRSDLEKEATSAELGAEVYRVYLAILGSGPAKA